MNPADHHLLTAALSAAELMGVGAVRSLDLLRDIDGTIEAVTHYTNLFETAEREFSKARVAVASGHAENQIPEEDIVPILESLQDKLGKAYPYYQAKMECAIDDPRLSDDDGVVDAFENLLQALDALNNTTEMLRWCILESNVDAEASFKPKILSNTKEIDSFLDSL